VYEHRADLAVVCVYLKRVRGKGGGKRERVEEGHKKAIYVYVL